ncbi:hypothetical protein FOA52_001956, partial [Chlamydomonas sp. UWO 241]
MSLPLSLSMLTDKAGATHYCNSFRVDSVAQKSVVLKGKPPEHKQLYSRSRKFPGAADADAGGGAHDPEAAATAAAAVPAAAAAGAAGAASAAGASNAAPGAGATRFGPSRTPAGGSGGGGGGGGGGGAVGSPERAGPRRTDASSLRASVGSEVESMGVPSGTPLLKDSDRAYHFATEVWSGPPGSAFSRTKVVTVRSRYMLLNETRYHIQYKQVHTPDPRVLDEQAPLPMDLPDDEPVEEVPYGTRFAGVLPPHTRVGMHWDMAGSKKELVIRTSSDCHWSGGFPLPEREQYFGLKIRRKSAESGRALITIIPVSITVGASGQILITLKRDSSAPPYMILNRCRDIVIVMRQKAHVDREEAEKALAQGGVPRSASIYYDRVGWDVFHPDPTAPVPFAWDEPTKDQKVEVVATFVDSFNKQMAARAGSAAEACTMNSPARGVHPYSWQPATPMSATPALAPAYSIPADVVGASKWGHWLPRMSMDGQEWTDIDLKQLLARSRESNFFVLLVANTDPLGAEPTTSGGGAGGGGGGGMASDWLARPVSRTGTSAGLASGHSSRGKGTSSGGPPAASSTSFAVGKQAKMIDRSNSNRSFRGDAVERSMMSKQVKSGQSRMGAGGPLDTSMATYATGAGVATGTIAMEGHKAAGGDRGDRSGSISGMASAVYAKKVYVSLYADGPTEVLCFSEDTTNLGSIKNESVLLSMSHRLQMLYKGLKTVDAQLGAVLAGAERDTFAEIDNSKVAPSLGRGGGVATPSQRSATAPATAPAMGSAPGNVAGALAQAQADALSGADTTIRAAARPSLAPAAGGATNWVIPGTSWVEDLLKTKYGGDLKVGVVSARGLMHMGKFTRVYAKISAGTEVRLTSEAPLRRPGVVEWSKEWTIRDMASMHELIVELWAVDTGTKHPSLSKSRASAKAKLRHGLGSSLSSAAAGAQSSSRTSGFHSRRAGGSIMGQH